jgi:hypothetical protein
MYQLLQLSQHNFTEKASRIGLATRCAAPLGGHHRDLAPEARAATAVAAAPRVAAWQSDTRDQSEKEHCLHHRLGLHLFTLVGQLVRELGRFVGTVLGECQDLTLSGVQLLERRLHSDTGVGTIPSAVHRKSEQNDITSIEPGLVAPEATCIQLYVYKNVPTPVRRCVVCIRRGLRELAQARRGQRAWRQIADELVEHGWRRQTLGCGEALGTLAGPSKACLRTLVR